MKRLAENNINSAEEYDRIYLERSKKPVDRQDMRRWKRLLKYYKGGNLIDLGCLDSQIPFMAKKQYPKSEVYGVDIAMDSMTRMKEKYPEVEFIWSDIYNLKRDNNEGVPDSYFNYAVLGEVIEHLEHPENAIKEAMRILKVGGTLALSTPLEEANEPGAVDAHRHLWSFSLKDIIDMLKPYGKVRTYILGSEYFPEYVYHFPTLLAYCKKK